MKNDKHLWEICMRIYRQAYKEADPPADFDDLIKIGVASKERWFMKYYLSPERQNEIVRAHIKKNKLNKTEATKVQVTVNLGCLPNSVR